MKTFGKADGVPLIFLHGGPGYNAAAFESVAAQLDALHNLLGPDHMITLDSCSHNVFIDRRHAFIEALMRHCKTK